MATDICIRLGKRVRVLRKAAGWSQTYFSVHTGLSRTFISDLELGRKEPCLRSIEILALAFGKSVSELTDGI